MTNKKFQKSSVNFNCELCDYNTCRESQYSRHLLTSKHTKRINTNQNVPKRSITEYICDCGKQYLHASSLWNHKQKCTINTPNDTDVMDNIRLDDNTSMIPQIDAPTIIELLKQNNEFKCLLVEQQQQLMDQSKQMMELAKNSGHSTINNTNCNNNNKFNLNVFLNETCKDAITMDDFIKSFEVTREDFIRTGNVGFIEGISTVMLSRFRNMETHTRPLHCTDLKRETVYIKNADKWEKEDANKTQLRRAVKVVAHRNMNELWRWYNDNKPEVEQIGTDECENYFKYYKAALGGCGKEEDLKFEEKIIKNVLKEVQVDKNMLTISD